MATSVSVRFERSSAKGAHSKVWNMLVTRCYVIGRHSIFILYSAFLIFSTCNVNCWGDAQSYM